MPMPLPGSLPLSRRSFFHEGALLLAGAGTLPIPSHLAATEPLVRVGLLTDLHYANKDPSGTRQYRDTLAKLAGAGEFFAKNDIDFIVELGDLIDAADSVEVEMAISGASTANSPCSRRRGITCSATTASIP